MKPLFTLLFLTATTLAQSIPPTCPTKPASHPTAQQIRQTAEAGAADPTVLLAAEPLENFGVERYRLADYADCLNNAGCYWADLDAQTQRAETALKAALRTHKPSDKLALILDIDETSLSSYCEMRHEAYGYIPSLFEPWNVSPAASVPIPGTLRLFHAARAAGISVFFITGRPDEQRAATAANLRNAGFEGWSGLRLRVGPEKSMSTADYKSAERQKILDAGYTLLMNVGDQWSDLNGTARAQINVKLPNPFYYLP